MLWVAYRVRTGSHLRVVEAVHSRTAHGVLWLSLVRFYSIMNSPGFHRAFGYNGIIVSSAPRTMDEMAALRCHFLSDGMTCHGACSVEQRSSIVS